MGVSFIQGTGFFSLEEKLKGHTEAILGVP